MDICNLIDYPAKREVAYVLTEEEIVQDLSIDPVLEDEVEADDIQEYILVKTSEALQCASLLQHISMQQDIVDHEMIAAIQTVKDKIALWDLASSFRSLSWDIFPRFRCPKCQKISAKSITNFWKTNCS